MKKYLLLSALALALPASANEYYFQSYGGGNWVDDDVDLGWLQVKAAPGYVIGGAFGTNVPAVPGLRLELDASYRDNGVDFNLCGTHYEGVVSDETSALLLNAVYDLPVKVWKFTPYVLAGAGYANRTVKIDSSDFSKSNSNIAWQVGAGFEAEVADGVKAGIGYRFFDAPDMSVGPATSEGNTQSVIATLRFALN